MLLGLKTIQEVASHVKIWQKVHIRPTNENVMVIKVKNSE